MYEHGTLYVISIPGWTATATRVVVQNDRVTRANWLLEWLIGATSAQLHEQIAERGWTALALRAATPDDCRRPTHRVVSSLSPPIARRE